MPSPFAGESNEPMTPAIAPEFTRRHPEAAAIFDNLHSMHDVISDILASPVVPRDEKRAAILAAAARYRDDTTEAMSRGEWIAMANEMGIGNMGGPAGSILPPPLEPSPMGGMDHGMQAGHEMPAGQDMPAEHEMPAGQDTPADMPAGHEMPADQEMPANHEMPTDSKKLVDDEMSRSLEPTASGEEPRPGAQAPTEDAEHAH